MSAARKLPSAPPPRSSVAWPLAGQGLCHGGASSGSGLVRRRRLVIPVLAFAALAVTWCPVGRTEQVLLAGNEPSAAAARGNPPPARTSPGTVDWRPLAAIALAVAAVAGFRIAAVRRRPALPADVFEVLGSAPLAAGQSVRVVRFGPKTLLVAVSASGCQALSEVDDPDATAALVAACAPSPAVTARPWPRVPRGFRGAAIVGAAALVSGMVVAGADEGRVNMPAEVASLPAPSAGEGAVLKPITAAEPRSEPLPGLPDVTRLVGPRSLETMLPSLLLVGVMTLAPAVLLMTTCFVRMSVVLSLVRLGLGAPQVPSNQIVAALALFLSALVMWPVWTRAWQEGIEPWQQGSLPARAALERGSLPVRRWMAAQIEQGGNRDTMLFFLARHPSGPRTATSYDDVPVEALLPAFLVSELETSFAIGLRLLLPFLVIDILVATLVVSTGLVMLPPTLVAVPLKLLAFVAADGWTLVVRSLLDSVRVVATG